MIWAALYFPDLALDRSASLPGPGKSSEPSGPYEKYADVPRAIIEQHGAKRLIMSCNTAARTQGIESGLALKAAYAICPQLETDDYDEVTQKQYLEELCLWALQFSSWVTPCMPDIILLEIEASLKLFGGLAKLLKRLEHSAHEQKLTLVIGVAPTPSAARLLAQVNSCQASNNRQTNDNKRGDQALVNSITDLVTLESVLASLPVSFLPLDAFTQKGLRQSGIKHCSQLFKLPATALTRRFGEACTELIYRLLGRIPEPCPAYQMPESFLRSLDLPLEAPDTNALQFPMNRLLGALGGYLRASDSGVKTLNIKLYHPRCKASITTIGFLEATADHKHLLRVATERLANKDLPEPVSAITIEALETDSITRSGKDLFNKSESQSGTIEQALDLLGARIGRDKIYTPSSQKDHRPEKASATSGQKQADWAPQLASPLLARPLWLLPEARPANRPLTIMSQAERIENGWWDTDDVRRDYYIATDRQGVWFWVYCERSYSDQQRAEAATGQVQYFIHGLFA